MADPTLPTKRMAPVSARATKWIAESSVSEILDVREAQIAKIEDNEAELRETGACERWLNSCDRRIQGVIRDVNGPLLETLLGDLNYHDVACIEVFQTGLFWRMQFSQFMCTSRRHKIDGRGRTLRLGRIHSA